LWRFFYEAQKALSVITDYYLKFFVSGVPKATNALLGRHWWAKSKNADEWKNKVAFELMKRSRPPEPLTRCRLNIIRHSNRTLDYDGCVASMKPIVDALVVLRILENDTYRITGQWNVLQAYCPKAQERIEVEVIEADPIGVHLLKS